MRTDPPDAQTLLTVNRLVVEFPLGRRSKIHAVSDVSLRIEAGANLGLVGESGCGKTTLAKAVVGLLRPTRGEIRFAGRELTANNGNCVREAGRGLQMIFQDAAASLNPGRSVGQSIAEPLRVMGGFSKENRLARVRELMGAVGLDPDRDFCKRPFEFSGGQCQRVSIARALIARPKLLVCDEPVSSLDVSVQAQILNLLEDMKVRYGLTLFFISHDLAVVKNICDRVAVMYLGKLCEIADSGDLYRSPRHPYTAALLACIPQFPPGPAGTKAGLPGSERPAPAAPPAGCRFHPRCPRARIRCGEQEPALTDGSGGRMFACHFPLD